MCKEINNEIQKTYSSFKSLTEVCEIFDYDYVTERFMNEEKYNIDPFLKKMLIEDFSNITNFTNEFVICERIISPILSEVAKFNNLPLWSHVKFEVEPKLGLSGEFDYMLAPAKRGTFTIPIVCLGEAKRDDFVKGWAQVGAEMIAAQKANKNTEVEIYGLVTTGKLWEFGKLKDKLFTIDTVAHAAPSELETTCNSLNWLFKQANKSLKLLEKEKIIQK